jgi:histone H3/H4
VLGGILTSINDECYNVIRQLADIFLSEIMRKSIIITEYSQRRIISERDIIHTLENMGIKVHSDFGDDLPRCKTKTLKKRMTEREFKRFRSSKQSQPPECAQIPKAQLKRIIKKHILDLSIQKHIPGFRGFSTCMKISKEALNLLQVSLEIYIIKVFYSCAKIAHHCGRNTLKTSDIYLYLNIINSE